MARLGAAVNIITTDGPGGRHGMTASAVCSLTDEPASLAVCINRNSRIHAAIEENGALCVNVLNGEHEELSGLFARSGLSMAERFANAQWERLANGTPGLLGALCNLACSVMSVSEIGTHTMFFCRVEDIRMGPEGHGLVYFGRSYHRLTSAPAA